jgi:hypothetical protein
MYTTHGYMTRADYEEYMEDTDQGAVHIDLADPPGWLDLDADCDICLTPIGEHAEVTVTRAAATVVECVPGSGSLADLNDLNDPS